MHEHLVDLVIATVRVPSTTSASGETQDAGVENDVVMVEGWNTRPVHLGGGGGGGGGSEGGEGGGEGGGGGGEMHLVAPAATLAVASHLVIRRGLTCSCPVQCGVLLGSTAPLVPAQLYGAADPPTPNPNPNPNPNPHQVHRRPRPQTQAL